jgi:predicted acylesterase/phospholipase RssA
MLPLERLQRARKIGFLFSGGAARCMFQVGVAETLQACGIHPSICLGVSGGAWNAAAVAVGNTGRLRAYWRFFSRMPSVDVRNLFREHSPWIWRRLHERAFRRYVSAERLKAESTIPLYVALTRLRDRANVIMDVRASADPLELMLASNYLPPFYTHAPVIDGERYGDAGFSDNLPYEMLFEHGCDAIVLMSQKGECEGGLFRHVNDPDHVVPERYRDRVIVIRPRRRLELKFAERRWNRLAATADLGATRAREVLYGTAAAPEPCRHGHSPSWYLIRLRQWLSSHGGVHSPHAADS